MATEMPMRAGEAAPEETEREEISVFIPAAALGGREFAEGDRVTLEVRAIDPETGEVEAMLAELGERAERPSRMMAAMDELPDDDEETY